MAGPTDTDALFDQTLDRLLDAVLVGRDAAARP
jgi:hypothetical protein